MIRHIVLFKIKNFSSDTEKGEAIQQVLDLFRSMIGQIPQIRQYRVEKNGLQGDFSYDVIIDSVFDSVEDLKAYQDHPAHREAVETNRQWSEKKVVCDYFYTS
jgi:hypothetical protein